MKNIVLDTNILYQEGLASGRMKVLAKLVNAGLISVYIPDIVKREFITKRVSEIADEVKKIQGSLKTILRKTDSEGEFKERTNILDAGVMELMQGIQESVESEFSDWVDSLRANILNFEPAQINNVLDDYFTGSGAFKSLKSREDFPDSMIHHSICQLIDSIGEIYVILADGAFKRGIKDRENVITLNSLNDLLRLEDIEEFLASEQLKAYFVNGDFPELLVDYLSVEKNKIEEVYIPDGIENTALIGIRHYGAELNFPSPYDISDMEISDFYLISDTEFTADISFKTFASLHYVSDYGSYLELESDSSRTVELDSMNGDGMCDLLEIVSVQYSGKINLSFTEPQTAETIDATIRNLVNDDTAVSIILDIDSAHLLSTVK
ncbi:PIN domain-containing protein [Vibrio alginolyticus]